MEKFKFSVSMCVYGGDTAEYFNNALQSILEQTLQPDEIVLVVDGPVSEAIENVIADFSLKYDNFFVFRLPENVGHGNARREGFSHCRYDYIAITDADDIQVHDRFEKQIEYFKRDFKLSAISSACYHFVDSIDNIINIENVPENDEQIKKFLRKRCPLCQSSVMLKKADVIKAGGYLDWYHCEDYYLWSRMFLCGAKFANIVQPLVYVRSNSAQMSRRGGWRYFISMKRLFDFMLKNKIINFFEYLYNVVVRFMVQIMMPNFLRAYLRKKFL